MLGKQGIISSMKYSVLLYSLGALSTGAAEYQFEKPYQLKGGDNIIQVEGPGYAAPCIADLDKDGVNDLLVGQFNGGKIKFYRGFGEGKFARGEWLKANGDPVTVPGVW